MDRRFALFAVLVALIFIVNQIIFSYFAPPKDPKAQADKAKAVAKDAEKPAAEQAGGQPQNTDAQIAGADDQPATTPEGQPAPAATEEPEPEIAPQRGTLGSLDPASGFRMLVTWNNQGAAIETVELNRFRALENEKPWGYLGYLAPINAENGGALVRVVGAGTPAHAAGLQAGDVITALGETKIRTAAEFVEAIQQTRPGDQVTLSVQRGETTETLQATLRDQPLDLIRPEFEHKAVEIVEEGKHDQLSFLTTIQQFDDRTLSNDDKELGGVNLRTSPWEVAEADATTVRFRKRVGLLGLEVIKTYRLVEAPNEERENVNYPAYHLTLEVSVTNVGDKAHQVAYRLDGPNGLPTEGDWYASKVSHDWGAAGLRDVIAQFAGGGISQITPADLADPEFKQVWGTTASIDYIAVDAQYFSAALIPAKKEPNEILFESVMPIRVGQVPKESSDNRLINVSFRMDSTVANLEPGQSLSHSFQVFAGPKRRSLLSEYGPDGSLANLVYYGWFGPIARVLGQVLHLFYSVVGNYGIAIILLTVVVRGCMFPLSRKQALGAQKMQELQPEMKKINEKYKNDAEKRTRATQELFRQHNYNPLGGCLLAFAQLPIFVGLYRSLMVNVELRQAPLFSDAIRWASNLAAPDMLWNWSHLTPDFVSRGTGMFGLGPYLNILPLVTVGLFIWQQKMFMPPPADEQAALQQKMMQYMMIFMGILFFKVASGLCVYFIASSIWGVCERKLLPKAQKAGEPAAGNVIAAAPSGNGTSATKRRQRGGRK